jgi:1-deoxy-D-xylulose-5-phosphate reductoisomerase
VKRRLRIGILGSTGSIGLQALEIVRQNTESFEVVLLAAQRQIDLLEAQAREFSVTQLAVADFEAGSTLAQRSNGSFTVLTGHQAAAEAIELAHLDAVVVGIIGFAAFGPVVSALKHNVHIALANKEVLVAAQSIIKALLLESDSIVVPVDSEHNSIYQCMLGRARSEVRKIAITASGGPFLHSSREQLAQVTPAQAAKHPNWEMGRKISIDSATLMNKGLEVIEAAALFDLDGSKIEVLIHPQSYIHGLVEYKEGTAIAALYKPSMQVPIAFALDYIRKAVTGQPEVSTTAVAGLDLAKVGKLEFYSPDLQQFPCLGLAYRALRAGGCAATVLNAANEVAVDAFCAERISFLDIPSIVETTMDRIEPQGLETIEDVLKFDSLARRKASEVVENKRRACAP